LGEEPFTYDGWREAVSAGRTFLSGGPMLAFEVEGHGIGDVVHINGTGSVAVSALAESVLPISTLEIVQNGRVVASTSKPGSRRLELTTEILVEGNCWLAARCGGPDYFDAPPHRDVWDRGVFAHTSPVYVSTEGEFRLFDAQQASYMLTLIEGTLAYIRHRAVHYRDGHVTHHHGEVDHVGYLERPFHEARERLERRFEQAGEPIP
jgi:hypothetical protein